MAAVLETRYMNEIERLLGELAQAQVAWHSVV
jgi:hypothetical protein